MHYLLNTERSMYNKLAILLISLCSFSKQTVLCMVPIFCFGITAAEKNIVYCHTGSILLTKSFYFHQFSYRKVFIVCESLRVYFLISVFCRYALIVFELSGATKVNYLAHHMTKEKFTFMKLSRF